MVRVESFKRTFLLGHLQGSPKPDRLRTIDEDLRKLKPGGYEGRMVKPVDGIDSVLHRLGRKHECKTRQRDYAFPPADGGAQFEVQRGEREQM